MTVELSVNNIENKTPGLLSAIKRMAVCLLQEILALTMRLESM